MDYLSCFHASLGLHDASHRLYKGFHLTGKSGVLVEKKFVEMAKKEMRCLSVRRSSSERVQHVLQQDSGEHDGPHVQEALRDLIQRSTNSRGLSPPETSLREGRWAKLICGASFEDVADIRNLSLVYTLAGGNVSVSLGITSVDCIDCAADSAVVAAVLEGVTTAQLLSRQLLSETFSLQRPWIMVSINDDEDPHFRKAEFDAELCPVDCPRPCERVCPAAAIAFNTSANEGIFSNSEAETLVPKPYLGGVITERCYGCGRCLPICPLGLIRARTYVRELESVADLLRSCDIDAIEIHTSARNLEAFQKVVTHLTDALQLLKLIAVSLPDLGKSMVPTLTKLFTSLQPCIKGHNLWQDYMSVDDRTRMDDPFMHSNHILRAPMFTSDFSLELRLDGRPMSGDIGAGATRAAVTLASHVAASHDRPPGFIQLAGGTNAQTVDSLKREGLFLAALPGQGAVIAGVAYGGYARKIVSKYLAKMETCGGRCADTASEFEAAELRIEHYPPLLLGALQEATGLVAPLKGY